MTDITKQQTVTATPHFRSSLTVRGVMADVILALTPAGAAGVCFFGLRALFHIAISVAACVFFEFAFCKITKKPLTVYDLSAVVTGLLLAFNVPAAGPLWLTAVGAFAAIIIAKQLFGGLGQNFVNPALFARAFLLTSYAPYMTRFALDGVTAATPLAALKEGALPERADYFKAFWGNIGGCIGETCVLALVLGAAYLLVRKIISWRIPVTYVATVFLLSLCFGRNGFFTGLPVYEIITGGLLLGAFFMATDYATSPVTPKGQFVFAAGCGLLTVVIRVYGGYPEGVSYSILLMNLTVPLIEKITKPRVYGAKKRGGRQWPRRFYGSGGVSRK